MRIAIATAVLALLTTADAARAQAPKAPVSAQTRYFPAQKCQFTLPTRRWSWTDQPLSNTFFAAESATGLIVRASCAPAAAWRQMDESAAKDFESSLVQSSGGQLRKRGAVYVQYHGLSSYQVAGVYADGKTTVSRCFLAHGLAYHILVVGGKNPVEQEPDFENIMNGFAFTEAPVAAPAPSYGFECAVFIVLLVLCLFAGLVRELLRSSKPRRFRVPAPDYDDDDEVDVVHTAAPASVGHPGFQANRPTPAGYGRSPASRKSPDESLSPRARSETGRGAGECRHCGYRPVAFGADECPRCAGSNPNPGVVTKFTGRGALGGALVGVMVGGSLGYLSFGRGGGGGAIAGGLVGTLAGVILGLAIGLFAGLTARMLGRR